MSTVSLDSPPLARGRHLTNGSVGALPGLTPARAGKAAEVDQDLNLFRTHPRSRGEGNFWFRIWTPDSDSPPLARGRRRRVGVPDDRVGLTPARAGKAVPSATAKPHDRTHPRSRGEGRYITEAELATQDSPPLARGRLALDLAAGRDLGLTPARAGKAPAWASRNRSDWTHPRSRGEGATAWGFVVFGRDSPPLARGRPPGFNSSRLVPGLTPARAGKASPSLGTGSSSWTHPRSRGEGPLTLCRFAASQDSPPLARGRHGRQDAGDLVQGLTPARAGKATGTPTCQTRTRTHPRSRGEGPTETSPCPAWRDSPPLARGRPVICLGAGVGQGLTPARAGKAGQGGIRLVHQWTHPRSRGEGRSAASRVRRAWDSPPLARGRRRDLDTRDIGKGLTPARAGKATHTQPPPLDGGTHPRSRGEGTPVSWG